jgi:hypothetical protein
MGTFGRLELPDRRELWTLELPWAGNERHTSCIPPGRYPIVRGNFRGLYPNWELQDVPGRSHIEIHRGNVVADLRGCIAPGTALGALTNRWGVLHSRDAMAALMESTAGFDSGRILIREETMR